LPLSAAVDEALAKRAHARIGIVLKEKYRLDAVLGLGGMAAVYAATHRNGKRFAVKLLHPELSLNEETRTRFLREGYVANTVGHPGAVQVFDDDVAEDGSAFLVMELLHGMTLEALRKRAGGRLPRELVLGLGHQLLDALAAAHAHGIVHRDIKPANVFATPDGQIKVLDFGLARLRTAPSASATQSGTYMGTPAFMAPEQALAQSTSIDAQTDVWSVGASFFTLAAGQYVHEAENATQIAVLAATQRARSLASVLPDAEPPLVHLVDRALSWNKADRWPSAAAMRDATSVVALTIFGRSPSSTQVRDAIASITPLGTAAAPLPIEAPEAPSPSLARTRPSQPRRGPEPTPSLEQTRASGSIAVTAAAGTVRRSPWFLRAAGVVLALAAVAGAARWTKHLLRPEPASPPPATVSPTVKATSQPTAAAPALVSPTTTAPSSTLAVRPVDHPLPPSRPQPSRSKALVAPKANPAPAPAAEECRWVSYYGEDGNKHYKQECGPGGSVAPNSGPADNARP
jgi:eukaryotic-like serine/threonine-protein kinase